MWEIESSKLGLRLTMRKPKTNEDILRTFDGDVVLRPGGRIVLIPHDGNPTNPDDRVALISRDGDPNTPMQMNQVHPRPGPRLLI